MGSISDGGNSPLIVGWILWPSSIQQKERNLGKHWDLAEAWDLTMNLNSKSE